MNTINQSVTAAINNMKALDSAYWDSTLTQRLANGAGSHYPQYSTKEELETALLGADWDLAECDEVMPGCTVYRAGIAGVYGMTTIGEILGGITTGHMDYLTGAVKQIKITLRDRKGTGKVTAEVSSADLLLYRLDEDYTYLIVGEEEGKSMCFTFHPGEPITPSVMESVGMEGKVITAQEAQAMGIKDVKIIFS